MVLQKAFRIGIALRRRFRQSEATFILLAVIVGAVGGGLAVLLGAAAHRLQIWLYHLPGSMRLSASPHLETKTLVITGIATNSCVLFTANDAFLRGYELFVPRDCVAANSDKLSRQALAQMENVLKAKIESSTRLPWNAWRRQSRAASRE